MCFKCPNCKRVVSLKVRLPDHIPCMARCYQCHTIMHQFNPPHFTTPAEAAAHRRRVA